MVFAPGGPALLRGARNRLRTRRQIRPGNSRNSCLISFRRSGRTAFAVKVASARLLTRPPIRNPLNGDGHTLVPVV